MLRLTTQVAEKLQTPRGANDDPVFRHKVPLLVPTLYKEHVEGWYAQAKFTDDQRQAWERGMEWLRSLEAGMDHRLFCHQSGPAWATQIKIVVSRRATSRRLSLPLHDDIERCVDALKPHFVVWILGLVDEKHLDMAMYPKILLQRASHSVRHTNHAEMGTLVQLCCDLYPKHVKPSMIKKQAISRAHYPCYPSHWPGLRLCPPFFPDLAALQLPPSHSIPRQGKYIVLHALHALHASHALHADTSMRTYALTSLSDARTCALDKMALLSSVLPTPLAVRVSDANEAMVFETLSSLHGMHPRSVHPLDQDSPFAKAAAVLGEHVAAPAGDQHHHTTEGGGTVVALPEHALDATYDMGFSFVYLKPTILRTSEVTWDKTEVFYQVQMAFQGEDHTFSISPYVGWGLRLRHTLLSLCPLEELKGQGLGLVLPDGVEKEVEENVLLTCLGWLRDVGLCHTKIVLEKQCHRACLSAMVRSTGSGSDNLASSSWASLYDGPVLSRAVAQRRAQNPWGNAEYTTVPLKRHLVEKIRDHLLCHESVKTTLEGLRYAQRAGFFQSLKCHLPSVLATLENGTVANRATPSIPVTLDGMVAVTGNVTGNVTANVTGNVTGNVTANVPVALYHQWVDECVALWTTQPWWTTLRQKLDTCKGIVVSGGIFECCPTSVLASLMPHLGPHAQRCIKPSPLNVVHGASMVLYAEHGCSRIKVRRGDGGDPSTAAEYDVFHFSKLK